ncbi:glycosyltransferase [Oceanispirochaeta crateris]|uniref:Glycosyltransferase n=1 Tax=Oceanispirochaeta crateris TaxID=2518645 RepID=A0A5C1QHE6_9SPIO|nr:glycosyltransferase family 2 protein [Oceanispirochaeta crateris]QEN06991.1 glycosyltransferase [Oceanispirochaeta crateris]
MRKADKISIVVPIFNEEANINLLYKRLMEQIPLLDLDKYEILFVSDGSTDESENIIKSLGAEDNNVKGLFFSRNHGHQFALKAGLDNSSGDVVVSMDADLQHPPELILPLYERWQSGFDIVQTIRKETEGAGPFKILTAKLYYSFLNFFSDVKVLDGAADFRLMDRKAVDVLGDFNESNLFMRGLIPYIGFKTSYIDFVAADRHGGESKYTIRKMFRFAMDGLMGFSIKPLRMATHLGIWMSFTSVLYLIYVIVSKFFLHNTSPGWSSLVSIVSLLGGIQLVCLGIIGEYVGRAFMELKRRPQYIIAERVNL